MNFTDAQIIQAARKLPRSAAKRKNLMQNNVLFETVYNIGYGDAIFSISTMPPLHYNAEKESLWYNTIEEKYQLISKQFYDIKVKTGELKAKIWSGAIITMKDQDISELYAALAEKLSPKFKEMSLQLEKVLEKAMVY